MSKAKAEMNNEINNLETNALELLRGARDVLVDFKSTSAKVREARWALERAASSAFKFRPLKENLRIASDAKLLVAACNKSKSQSVSLARLELALEQLIAATQISNLISEEVINYNLLRRRTHAGITRHKLAQHLDLSETTLDRFERQMLIPISLLNRLSEVLEQLELEQLEEGAAPSPEGADKNCSQSEQKVLTSDNQRHIVILSTGAQGAPPNTPAGETVLEKILKELKIMPAPEGVAAQIVELHTQATINNLDLQWALNERVLTLTLLSRVRIWTIEVSSEGAHAWAWAPISPVDGAATITYDNREWSEVEQLTPQQLINRLRL